MQKERRGRPVVEIGIREKTRTSRARLDSRGEAVPKMEKRVGIGQVNLCM